MLQMPPGSERRRLAAEFLRGFRDIVPIMVATTPFGLVFGTLSVQHGLSVGEATLMSALVYGGASQFVALEFWADPLPFWTILMSALAVNLRNLLYSAAIGRKMAEWRPATRYTAFAFLTDPTFAIAELKAHDGLSAPYYFGLGIPLYVGWIVVTALGTVIGFLVRSPEAIGLDFLVTGYFLFLVVGFRKRKNALPVIGVSAIASLAAYLTVGPPWHFAAGALAGMAIAALLAARGRSA